MKKEVLILSGLALCGVSSIAAATEASGLYLGLEGGIANSQYSNTNTITFTSPFTPNVEKKVTANGSRGLIRLLGGYQFNKYVAIEVGSAIIPSVQFSLTSNIFDTKFVNSNEYIYDLNLKGIMPLDEHFSLYGKAGIASLNLKSMKPDVNIFQGASMDVESDHALTATFGAGLNYAFTSNFSMNLFYTGYLAKNSFGAINVGGVGLSYKF